MDFFSNETGQSSSSATPNSFSESVLTLIPGIIQNETIILPPWDPHHTASASSFSSPWVWQPNPFHYATPTMTVGVGVGGAGSRQPSIIQDATVNLEPQFLDQQASSSSGTLQPNSVGFHPHVYAAPSSVVLPTHPSHFAPHTVPFYDIDVGRSYFLFEKKLQPSDISSGRIVLPKRDVEATLPRLEDSYGISIKMSDADGLRAWTFRFRYWPNNGRRLYILENTAAFIKAHNLVPGDYAVFYKDNLFGFYIIWGKKELNTVTILEPERNAVAEAAEPRVSFPRVSLDLEVNKHRHADTYFPTMEEEVMKPPFLYDVAVSSDCPIDSTNLDPLPEIGSDESIWYDDFL